MEIPERELTYEQMVYKANNKLKELATLFVKMAAERASAASLVTTGELATARDIIGKQYMMTQVSICQMAEKLVKAIMELLV